MSSMNETQLVPMYQVVGSIDLPYLSYGTNRVDYKGDIFALFHEDVCTAIENIPHITPGKTAFFVRYKSNTNKNFNAREILALVQTVNDYRIDPNTHECQLSFTFTEIPINSFDPHVVIVEPTISHVFADHDYIALIFEGDSDYVAEHVNKKYKTFVHGGKMYWMIDTLQFNMHLRPGEPSIDTERPTLAIVVVASTLKVANEENHKDFVAMLNQYLNNIYGKIKEV